MASVVPPHPEPLQIEAVAFATGSGRLVRRATAVLFDPSGTNAKLTAAFDAATTDRDAIDTVVSEIVKADLNAAPFAIVSWTSELELIVFGDLDVETSCPSAPLISGASSKTWVEHRVTRALLAAQPSVQVWSGEAPEPDTNLRLGIAACAGFRLDLLDPLVPGDEPVTTATPAVGGPLDTVRDQVKEPVAPPAPEPPAADDVADGNDDTDADPFALDESAAPGVSPEAGVPGTTTSELLEFDPFAEPAADNSQPADSPQPAAEIDPVEPDVATEVTSVIGTLEFDNLPDIEIGGSALLGRRPMTHPEAGDELLVVDHPEVSRTHSRIAIEDGVASITDQASRNGTWVQPPTGGGLRRLDPGEVAELTDGTIVHLGSVEVCFTWRASS